MSLGDLAFLLALLLTVVGVCGIVYCFSRRRGEDSVRLVKRLGAFVAAYLGLVLGVSAFERTRVIPPGQSQCFDEWCLVVDGATRWHAIGATTAQGDFIVVATHAQNRGRGRPQREVDVYAVLRDSLDQRYAISSLGVAAYQRATGDFAALTDSIAPARSRAVVLVYDVPADARRLQLIVRHDRFPHALIIGDPESLFHRPTVVPVSPT